MNNLSSLLPEIDRLAESPLTKDEILLSICKLLKEKVYHYDWVGFYIADPSSRQLILGPFAGKPTEHKTIPFGKGICGQVAESLSAKIVQDVSKEDNYISCSLDVQSEIVVPVIKEGKFVAQIDIDSHSFAPFSSEDEDFLNKICDKIKMIF